jgi:hypothetical protein
VVAAKTRQWRLQDVALGNTKSLSAERRKHSPDAKLADKGSLSPSAQSTYRHREFVYSSPTALTQAAPLNPNPQPITETTQTIDLNIQRRDRLNSTLHEYEHGA